MAGIAVFTLVSAGWCSDCAVHVPGARLPPRSNKVTGMSTAVKGLVAYSHVNICVTDVEAADEFDATVAELAERGLEFASEPNEREDFGVSVKAAFARDPDGNLIEFTDVALFD